MIVASFDSGLERTGYAIMQQDRDGIDLIDCGCIVTKRGNSIITRLKHLCRRVDRLMSHYRPTVVVVERLFFNINRKTAITVAQAQGAVLGVLSHFDVETEFIGPTEVKQILTGYGKADKVAVNKMVRLLIKLPPGRLVDDVTDAIALGLAFCSIHKFKELIREV